MNAPTRPVLRWHGGKWKLAPWIIGHFPPHRIYVEPFGGAASVLIRKPRADLAEVYNDLDARVVNLFRVLRTPAGAERLISALRNTPYSRAEFELSYEQSGDPVEEARRLIIKSMMAFGTRGILSHGPGAAGFNDIVSRHPFDDWAALPEAVPAIAERFTRVLIESRDALTLIERHDDPQTLFYIDPPYLAEVRSDAAARAYRHDLGLQGHVDLLELLKSLAGMVAVSGYASDLYTAALEGWRRVETIAHADGARPRTEVLWINPQACAALDAARAQFGLFSALSSGQPPTPPKPERS